MKKKKETGGKKQITNLRNKETDYLQITTDVERMRVYYEQLYTNVTLRCNEPIP